MINTSKPTTSLSNSSRVVSYVTWDTNNTTFGTETRTWDQMGTNMSNTSKPTSTMTNTAKS